MATNVFSQALGIVPSGAISNGTQTLNAASTYVAYGFVPAVSKTVEAVRIYCSAVTGTLGSGDIVCDLWGASGGTGTPSSSSQLETGKLPTATITGAGYYDFTGFSTALNAGEVYWFVVRNVNGTPASNYATLRYVQNAGTGVQFGTALVSGGWLAGVSTNSGTSWGVNVNRVGHRVRYSDGTYDGFPMNNVAAGGSSVGVYSSREYGVVFTSPLNSSLRVSGLSIYISGRTGSPTGSPRIGLWTGSTPTLVGYAPVSGVPTAYAGMISGYLSSSVTIPPGTTCRVTLGETTNSDASTVRWNAMVVDYDTNANSTPLLPWNGTCKTTYFDGSAWSDGTLGADFVHHALLLDSSGEFTFSRPGSARSRVIGFGGAF